jgi:anti-sigma factor ChrR (cupin superfamily)
MTKLESEQLTSCSEEELSDELLEQALLQLAPATPRSEVRARLLQRVSALPLRYAPFYARLATMWGMPEPHVEAFLAESTEMRWHHIWPGIRYLDVARAAALDGARARLLRFEPGVRFPTHQHRGEEHVLVLEGSYTDSTGKRVGAGDEQRMVAGSEHALVISSDAVCVAAIVQRGLSFGAPLLDRAKALNARALSRLRR